MPVFGNLHAHSAQVTALIVDAALARSWGGSAVDENYELLDDCDFMRAMEADDEGETDLEVGNGRAVIADVSTSGFAPFWELDENFYLLGFRYGEVRQHMESCTATAAKLEPAGEVLVWGEVEVSSGCLAVLDLAEPGAHTDSDIERVQDSSVHYSLKHHLYIVKANASKYRVTWEPLQHEDEHGITYDGRVRIAPVQT